MRRKDAGGGRFLTRPDGEWAAVAPRLSVRPMNALPKFAGAVLARAGLLDEGEVARLERIAAGAEDHPTIDAAAAARILGGRR